MKPFVRIIDRVAAQNMAASITPHEGLSQKVTRHEEFLAQATITNKLLAAVPTSARNQRLFKAKKTEPSVLTL